MGLIESTDKTVKTLQGIHLYHAGRSNCSARVRLLLEEKGLPWDSHHIDIYQRKNVTPEYFAINPKGVVPTLVHDGRVIVESNDIMAYLEECFAEPCFTPPDLEDRKTMAVWLKRSGDIHIPGIKTFNYWKINARIVTKTPEEVTLYRQLQKDPDLLAFHAKHDLPGSSFSEADVQNARDLLDGALADMAAAIERTGWLVGEAYSLADISWAPTYTTLTRAGFPLDSYRPVAEWYARISERPAFQRAVTDWATPPPPKD